MAGGRGLERCLFILQIQFSVVEKEADFSIEKFPE